MAPFPPWKHFFLFLPGKVVPNNRTPATIMAVDTISSVKSSILLKVLLDSGSTITMINKKCLPRNCKPCKIASSRQINTLTGTYTSPEVVIDYHGQPPKLKLLREPTLGNYIVGT